MAWHPGQAYGQDLRDRVLEAEGTVHAVAERYAVSDSYVARARGKRRRLGEVCAGVQRNHVPPRLAGLESALAAQVAVAADQTLAQWCGWVRQRARRAGGSHHHVEDAWPVGPEPQKKTLHASEQERADVDSRP